MRSRITWTRSPARKRRPHALADDLVCVLAPGVAVVAQRVDGHQAFDKQIGQFDEQAVFVGVQHQRGKLLADAILHEADLLPLHEFAFGLCGAALGLAGFFGNLGEFGFGDWGIDLGERILLRAWPVKCGTRLMGKPSLWMRPRRAVAAFGDLSVGP